MLLHFLHIQFCDCSLLFSYLLPSAEKRARRGLGDLTVMAHDTKILEQLLPHHQACFPFVLTSKGGIAKGLLGYIMNSIAQDPGEQLCV